MTGEVVLSGTRVEGSLHLDKTVLSNSTGHALNGQRMRIDQALVWKDVEVRDGKVSLNGAHVGELDDHPDDWPAAEALLLDGFTYDRIKGKVSNTPERRRWVENGSYFDEEFRPQPFTQYAKFLRETGHDADARRVLFRREYLLRRHERARWSAFWRQWRGLWDGLLRRVIGYGFAPFRSMWWLGGLILATWIPAYLAWSDGSMAPNSGPIMVSEEWAFHAAKGRLHEPNPAAAWSAGVPGKDWESFSSFAYAMDVVIPIINFGQTDAWAPSTERQFWGRFLYWWRWVMTIAGWIVTALGAAAITGYVSRD